MKEILKRIGYLVGVVFFLSLPSFADSNTCEYFAEHNLSDQQWNEKKKKYQQERLDYIVKYAELSADEKSWLDKELKIYDRKRAEVWLEIKNIRTEVEKKSNSLSDDQYLGYLNQLIELQENMGKIHKDMAEKLKKKFSPKKAYIVYDGIKNHNRNVARKVRAK